jgi:hypothetical protein
MIPGRDETIIRTREEEGVRDGFGGAPVGVCEVGAEEGGYVAPGVGGVSWSWVCGWKMGRRRGEVPELIESSQSR